MNFFLGVQFCCCLLVEARTCLGLCLVCLTEGHGLPQGLCFFKFSPTSNLFWGRFSSFASSFTRVLVQLFLTGVCFLVVSESGGRVHRKKSIPIETPCFCEIVFLSATLFTLHFQVASLFASSLLSRNSYFYYLLSPCFLHSYGIASDVRRIVVC